MCWKGSSASPNTAATAISPAGASSIFPANSPAIRTPTSIGASTSRPLPPNLRRKTSKVADSIADVCLVGVGAVGGILAKQLASAGLKVVGFERGPEPRQSDYAPRDSIRFIARADRLDWVRHEPTRSEEHTSELQSR